MIFILSSNFAVWSSLVGKGTITLSQLDFETVCVYCVCISIATFFRLPRKSTAHLANIPMHSLRASIHDQVLCHTSVSVSPKRHPLFEQLFGVPDPSLRPENPHKMQCVLGTYATKGDTLVSQVECEFWYAN